ncbi:hypothetical protein [Kibdelosporangium philippinense]|uniref:hypothetical protein n=1 Tax=Kibdelosporangium philippinense TaxID=211113 RepID=UPI00361C1B6D
MPRRAHDGLQRTFTVPNYTAPTMFAGTAFAMVVSPRPSATTRWGVCLMTASPNADLRFVVHMVFL